MEEISIEKEKPDHAYHTNKLDRSAVYNGLMAVVYTVCTGVALFAPLAPLDDGLITHRTAIFAHETEAIRVLHVNAPYGGFSIRACMVVAFGAGVVWHGLRLAALHVEEISKYHAWLSSTWLYLFCATILTIGSLPVLYISGHRTVDALFTAGTMMGVSLSLLVALEYLYLWTKRSIVHTRTEMSPTKTGGLGIFGVVLYGVAVYPLVESLFRISRVSAVAPVLWLQGSLLLCIFDIATFFLFTSLRASAPLFSSKSSIHTRSYLFSEVAVLLYILQAYLAIVFSANSLRVE